MRIAGIQMSAGADVDKNIGRAVELVEVAAEKGAKIIGFPELCLHPWFPRKEDPARLSLACDVSGAMVAGFVKASL